MPLEIHIQGIDLTNMEARMQAMARPTYAAISNYVGDGKPAILFVPTRKHARMTALDMLTFAAADGKPQKFLQVGFSSPCSEACFLWSHGRHPAKSSDGLGSSRRAQPQSASEQHTQHKPGSICDPSLLQLSRV